MPAGSASRKPLKVGDTVEVFATVFGIEWAKQTYPQTWRQEKLQGKVVGKASSKWRLEFEEGDADENAMVIQLARKDISFMSRTEVVREAADDEEDEEPDAEEPTVDSSDEEDEGIPDLVQDEFFNEPPDHEVKTGKKGDAALDIMAGWKRDDEFAFDQRAKYDYTGKPGARLNNLDVEGCSLFKLGCHFLPMAFGFSSGWRCPAKM
jgi:hypothetical protein